VAVSVKRGSWPGGAEESIRRYTARKIRITAKNADREEFLLHLAAPEK